VPAAVDRRGRVTAAAIPETMAGRGGSALRRTRVGFSLGQQSLEIDHMAASSPAREQIHIRLSLDPETRALLERLAAIDERSIAHTASLLIKASLRARQGEVTEGAAHG
jgi:hypothetical protein